MALRSVLTSSCVFPNLVADAKEEALTRLSAAAARAFGLDSVDVFEALIEREAQGSTGFGGGVAVPHGKIAGLGAVSGLFARLGAPLDWDALDGAPVDVVFVLLAPEGAAAAHLKALAKVSNILREPETRAALRATGEADALYALLIGGGAKTAAA